MGWKFIFNFITVVLFPWWKGSYKKKDNGYIWSLVDTTENDRGNMKMNKHRVSLNNISEDVTLWIKYSLLKGIVKNVY